MRLTLLRQERARRDAAPVPPAQDDETRLFWLKFIKWFRALEADAERQCQVCLVLGISPPEEVDPYRAVAARWSLQQEAIIVDAREEAARLVPSTRTRPWYWCHEARVGNVWLGDHRDWPIVYAHDWNPETHPDLYGFADRWQPGEVLVIPADELPVEAEVVPSRPSQCAGVVRGESEDGVEVAEVVEDAPPSPREKRGGLIVSGGWRTLGTIDRASGEFRPSTMHPFG